ncbi:MAG: ABC transporter permease, partial [Mycobacteriales bacterium]
PDVVRWLLWCTPFPYMLQVPLDIAVERTSATAQLWLVAAQCGVAALAMGLCVWAQRAGARKLVIQGG